MKTKISKILTICIISVIIISAFVIPSSATSLSTEQNNTATYPIQFNHVTLGLRKQDNILNYLEFDLPTRYTKAENVEFTTNINNPLLDNSIVQNRYVQRYYEYADGLYRTYLWGNIAPKNINNLQTAIESVTFSADMAMIDNISSGNFYGQNTIYLNTGSVGQLKSITFRCDVVYPRTDITTINNDTEAEIYTYAYTDYYSKSLSHSGTGTNYIVNLPLQEIYNLYVDKYNSTELTNIVRGVILKDVRIRFDFERSTNSNQNVYFNLSTLCGQWDNIYTGITDLSQYQSIIPLRIIEFEDVSFIDWIANNINDLMGVELIPYVTIGGIVWVIVGIGLLFAILKIFMGG